MGIRGTDIAKDAADIVLLNDSFTTVIVATKYGRNIYDCIRKFLQFQLTTNVVAVFMTLLGGIVLKDAPLNAIQMLWVNLIMDSFASLALATEPPTDSLLERKPFKKGSSIITTPMLINVASQSVFQIILLTIILFYGDVIFGVPSDRELSHSVWNDVNGYHFTIFFNIFVFMQVFNSLNSRKLKKSEKNIFANISNNPIYIIIQIVTVIGQITIVTIGGRAMRTHPLTLGQHLKCALISSGTLVIGFLAKFLPIDDEDDKSPEEKSSLKAKSILTLRGGLKRSQTQMITSKRAF
jgi:magnesium-transporting ATPase (P-type)